MSAQNFLVLETTPRPAPRKRLASSSTPRRNKLVGRGFLPGWPSHPEMFRMSVQFGILGLGLFQDWNVGIGVFPKCQEILVSRSGFCLVTGERIGAA